MGPTGVPVLSDMGGAVQRRLWEVARQQARIGCDVTVLSPGGGIAGPIIIDGVRVVRIPLIARRPIRDYEYLLRCRVALSDFGRADVLHSHGVPDAARVLSHAARVSVQTVDFHRYRGTDRTVGIAYYTSSLNRYDAILPVSDYCAFEFRKYFPRVRAPIFVIPNGVDITQFRPDPTAGTHARRNLGLPAGDLVVYLGRVCHQKGSDLLGALAEQLRDANSNAHVVAVGPPEQFGEGGRSRLMDEISAQGVYCTGAVPERLLRGVLNMATLAVLPTREDEMFGMAALEAIACGTPVVASNLGGIPEAVGDVGVLFEPGSAEGLSTGVGELLANPDRRHQLQVGALAHASRFSWPTIVEELMVTYGKLLSGK